MSHAFVPSSIIAAHPTHRFWRAVGAWALGVASLVALARLSIPLPGTPVPMTGQTFGVAVIALISGRRLASSIVATYLAAGILGAPMFAHGAAFVSGATSGYLIGMLMASVAIGTLADLGWARSWRTAFLASYLGSALTFTAGLVVVSRFVPAGATLAAGLYPFLLADLIKNLAAATLVRAVTTSTQH
jgi:biotin transport system substrate-specific component